MSGASRRVGFIGLGTMGSRMAPHLLRAGHDLVVTDVRRDAAEPLLAAGAVWADDPAGVAAAADVIILSLPTPAIVEAVVAGPGGIVESLRAGHVVFDTSTNSRAVVLRLAALLAEHDAHLLDAPVSGGPTGAESGRLAILVGGDEDVFVEHLELLETFADRPVRVGDVGHATVAKLVHNSMSYMINTAFAEAFSVGVKAGVDPVTLWAALRQGSLGRVRTFDRMHRQFLPGTYEPAMFALELAHKDLSLATELGRDVGVPMRLAAAAQAEMTEALGRGWGARDSRVSMLLQLERAGVELDVDPAVLQAVLDADGDETAA